MVGIRRVRRASSGQNHRLEQVLLGMRVIPFQVHGTIIFLVNGALFSPPLGAFGSGATFAMEDGWILARALEHTRFSSRPGQDALEIFNLIISPYYTRM